MSGARRLFAEDEVRELHAEALRIVAALDPPTDLRGAVYQSVISMCGQHQVAQPMLGLPLPGNMRPQ